MSAGNPSNKYCETEIFYQSHLKWKEYWQISVTISQCEEIHEKHHRFSKINQIAENYYKRQVFKFLLQLYTIEKICLIKHLELPTDLMMDSLERTCWKSIPKKLVLNLSSTE